MSNLENITYCGLYCRLCANKSRIPQIAIALRDRLSADGWEVFGEDIVKDFKTFWSVLNDLAGFEKKCPGCRGGCGVPECNIRNCAKGRAIELCPLCTEYPCQYINMLAQRYPTLIADGQRLKQIGLVSWVQEQEERRKTGFCYCDIRFPIKLDIEP